MEYSYVCISHCKFSVGEKTKNFLQNLRLAAYGSLLANDITVFGKLNLKYAAPIPGGLFDYFLYML
jgi:hypothetical protein